MWDPRENPHDHLLTKLSPPLRGPYLVKSQYKNDITCSHLVHGGTSVLHTGRCVPFIGTSSDAERIAMLDDNQYLIISINFYTGNPFVRQSMTFNVTFDDGTISMPYSNDLATSQQFVHYITTIAELYPLR